MALIAANGHISTERLIKELGISRETARRDIIELENQGAAKRVHAQQHDVAQQVLPFHGHAVDRDELAQRVQARKQHRHHNAKQEQQVDLAVKAKPFNGRALGYGRLRAALLAEENGIKKEKDNQ